MFPPRANAHSIYINWILVPFMNCQPLTPGCTREIWGKQNYLFFYFVFMMLEMFTKLKLIKLIVLVARAIDYIGIRKQSNI